MPSPLPGMDPYMESPTLWPIFHRSVVSSVHEILRPSLLDLYSSGVGERRYILERTPTNAGRSEERLEPYIEIWESNNGNLVTLIEVTSPENKTTDSGRKAILN